MCGRLTPCPPYVNIDARENLLHKASRMKSTKIIFKFHLSVFYLIQNADIIFYSRSLNGNLLSCNFISILPQHRCNQNFNYLILCSVDRASRIIFVNKQLDAQFFFIHVYFYSVHVSGSHVLIIRRINYINRISVICHHLF
jgi:hypothetical protein